MTTMTGEVTNRLASDSMPGLQHYVPQRATLLVIMCLLLWGGLDSCNMAQGLTDTAPDPNNSGSWTGFRGPGGSGHAVNANPPSEWNVEQGKNIRWKTEVPLPGASSPVVWGNRLFLTGADESSRRIYCFDTDTGQLLWQHSANDIDGSPSEAELPRVMEETGFAAPTPTTNGRFVAAIFGTGDLVCLTTQGERVWARNLGVPKNHYGHASSLISDGNLLFVQYDQKDGSRLLTFELATGNPAWQVDRSVISWSSPLLVDNKGRKELILTNSKAVDSHDPGTGTLLWQVECLDGEMAPSAAYANGIVCVAIEYGSAVAIDVSDHESEPKILWGWDKVLPDASSPLASEKYLFVPSGFGTVNCLDIQTGKVLWEHDFDVGFSSSPIQVNDRVYLADHAGNIQIFKLDSRFELLGTGDVGEDIFATPAFVGDKIYIRGVNHLFCVANQD